MGQQNTTTRLWAKTGSRPRAVRQQQFEYAHLFGAVCPATGATEALIVPFLSKDVMKKHLAQISAATAKGRFAVVVMDGAGWHTDDIADDFDNLAILKLPPYSPELNPIEQERSWTLRSDGPKGETQDVFRNATTVAGVGVGGVLHCSPSLWGSPLRGQLKLPHKTAGWPFCTAKLPKASDKDVAGENAPSIFVAWGRPARAVYHQNHSQ